MERDELRVIPLATAGKKAERIPLLRKLGEPVLEVNNDHFPTAIFQRRIVEVLDPSGQRCLALEDDMSLLRLEPVGTGRKATVASIRDEDKFAALDRVLEETGFDAILEAKRKDSGKARQDFSIVIKPNFMFAYDKRDRSTYTDPELVHHLVKRLRELGFENLNVVEAQSTYGEYFDKRSVREMADYLGYDRKAGYEVVDMTLDADEDARSRAAPRESPRIAQLARGGLPHLVRQEQDPRLRVLHAHAQEYLRRTATREQVQGIPLRQGNLRNHHRVPDGVPRGLRPGGRLPQR